MIVATKSVPVTSHRTNESQTDMPTPTPTPRRGSLILLLPIALILAVLAALFAWVGGWFGNHNLTPQKMMDFAETSGKQAAGFRRARSRSRRSPSSAAFPRPPTILTRRTALRRCAAWPCS